MRITFVLPTPIRIPMGGAKVVYAHAEGLARLGHTVRVVAPSRAGEGVRDRAMRWAVAARDRLHGVAGGLAYAADGVESITLPSPRPHAFPDADVTVATGVQTAPWVARLPESKGRRVYFVQGDETFVRPDARDSWHLGMELLTCARWLADAMGEAGLSPVAVIPNAIDPREFGLDRRIEGRGPDVLALYHRHPVKGPDVLLDALRTLLAERPSVRCRVFCARPPSHALPEGVDVEIRPSADRLRELYNRAAVLLHPSRSEGWPLVPMEAAACGAAVVASANPGVQEYLADGVSMRAVPIGDGDALGRAALGLLSDASERTRLATSARASVARYSWSDSTARLAAALDRIAR